ncbi:MAG: CHAD domain-containing protein [Acidobacteriota bacterium]|nr:CHAD domain-containing protein [Acidobacteriota bacterium]
MALDPNHLLKPITRLQKLIKNMDSQPSPDAVHDLRTNTRRLETIFEALSIDAEVVGGPMLKALARLRKRAGKVRDMDVFTLHASAIQMQGEQDSVVVLLEHLGAQRRKHAKKLYAEIQRRRPGLRKDLKRTPDILAKRINGNGDASKGSEAAANATATAVKLATQLAIPQRLGKDNLHLFRLKVKELRNILQMAVDADRNKFVGDLGKLKDAIGEWHDWEELLSIAQKVIYHGNRCGLEAELKRIAKRKCEHAVVLARSLRKTYLRNFRPLKKGGSLASPKISSEPVWKAIAMLTE